MITNMGGGGGGFGRFLRATNPSDSILPKVMFPLYSILDSLQQWLVACSVCSLDLTACSYQCRLASQVQQSAAKDDAID